MITKSLFLDYMRDPLAAWNSHNAPELSKPIDSNQQALFEGGHRVTKLARMLYPGDDASKGNTLFGQFAIKHTKALWDANIPVIHEGSFISPNGLYFIKPDIIVRQDGHVIEVKSSTSVKDEHILELGLYHKVLTDLGIPGRKYSLMYINKDYVRLGELDVNELFVQTDVTHRVHACQKLVQLRLKETHETILLSIPPLKKVGEHCYEPFDCAFKETCFKEYETQDSVLNIAGMRKKQKFYLLHSGIRTMSDLPRETKMNAKQMIQVQAHLNQVTLIDRDWLTEYFGPMDCRLLYFMDFETFNEPIPQYEGTKPYQQITFQYSVHKLEDGNVSHFEFLGEPGTDPRQAFIENLITDVGDKGIILTYNQAFELTRLKELAEAFPQHAQAIAKIMVRVYDLMVPFRALKIYSPMLKGSYSLKAVLPAFIKNLTYAGLVIHDGATASAEFKKMTKVKREEAEEIRKNLLAYCKMDTAALIEVWQFIKSLVEIRVEERIQIKKLQTIKK